MTLTEHYLENGFILEKDDGSLHVLTKNLVRGDTVYGEQLIEHGDLECRYWNPYRSKLAAAILCGAQHIPPLKSRRILYLGAASGTTASHVSDLVDVEGVVYCVEFSPRNGRDLVKLCERRPNMMPIIADARQPHVYSAFIQPVDVIYQDVSQPDQVEILRRNIDWFLKAGGHFLFALKTQSIDTSKAPEKVHKMVLSQLQDLGYEILESLNIHRYQSHHWFLIGVVE